jgi:hypothetical protein
MGDPRGEFITLQLARQATGGAPKKREKELLEAHTREWLGEIDWALLDEGLHFERGFVVRGATGRRGNEDLASHELGRSAPIHFTVEGEWSTVERLSVGGNRGGCSGLLASSELRSLREVTDVLPVDLDAILAGEPRRWEILTTFMTRSADWWTGAQHAARFAALPDALPQLRHLSFAARDVPPDPITRAVARMPHLQELSLAYRWNGLPELCAIGAERGLSIVRLLMLRVGKNQRMMRGPPTWPSSWRRAPSRSRCRADSTTRSRLAPRSR